MVWNWIFDVGITKARIMSPAISILCLIWRLSIASFSFLTNTSQAAVIWHVKDLPTMQFFTGVSWNTQSKSYNAIVDWVCGISKVMHCGILINMAYHLLSVLRSQIHGWYVFQPIAKHVKMILLLFKGQRLGAEVCRYGSEASWYEKQS